MNKEERARELVEELNRQVGDLELIGALIAAAHVDAAVETLCKEFKIERNTSVPD